jgi:hypothetical protein
MTPIKPKSAELHPGLCFRIRSDFYRLDAALMNRLSSSVDHARWQSPF